MWHTAAAAAAQSVLLALLVCLSALGAGAAKEAAAAAAAAAEGGRGFGLVLPRQQAAAVDFSGFPTCAGHCLTRWRALGCPTNPPTTDCFCGKPNPLVCATPADVSVSASCWSSAETWYASQCPAVPRVDTAAIPACAQQCFGTANTHCVDDLTKNCVCSYAQPACGGNCTTAEAANYDSWWAAECLYNLTTTTTAASSGTVLPTSTGTHAGTTTGATTGTGTSTAAPASSGGGGGVSTGTIVGAAVGGLAGTLAIGALVFFLCRRREPAGEKDAAPAVVQQPPPAYMLGPDGRPIAEMGIDGGVRGQGYGQGHGHGHGRRERSVSELMADTTRPAEAPAGFGGVGTVYEKAA